MAVGETMMALHRILVATDFSAAGHAAVARAGQLAAQFHCQLTVLHATPDWTLFSQRAAAHQAQYADITRNAEALMRGEVGWLAKEYGLTAVRSEVLRDRATLAVARAIETFQPDLLVIGAGGENIGAGGGAVLGGTALKLISRVSVPLLLARNASPAPYLLVLVAVGAEVSSGRRLIRWAFAVEGSGTCHVVRSYEAPYVNRMRLCGYPDSEIAKSADEQQRIAQQDCDALAHSVPAGKRLMTHIVRGTPVATVLAQVKEWGPQLVIIGQHQHHADEHPGAWAAGLGTRIAYHCPTDVLMIPAES